MAYAGDIMEKGARTGSQSHAGGPMGGPKEDGVGAKNTRATCDWWWLTGSHTWAWSGFWFYTQFSSHASSQTTYGTSTGTCGTPLTVDQIFVQMELWNGPTILLDRYNKTLYNINYVYAENSVTWWGSSGTPNTGISFHKAIKNGIQWSNSATSH